MIVSLANSAGAGFSSISRSEVSPSNLHMTSKNLYNLQVRKPSRCSGTAQMSFYSHSHNLTVKSISCDSVASTSQKLISISIHLSSMIHFSSKSTYLFPFLLGAFQPQNAQIMTLLIMKEIMKILMTMMMMMKNKRDGEEGYKNNSCGSDH